MLFYFYSYLGSSRVVPPALFPLVACQPGSGDKITVACLAKDFSPQTLTFQWTNAGGTAVTSVQYPFAERNNTYTEVSVIDIPKSDWDSMESFKCNINHQGSSRTVQVKSMCFSLLTHLSKCLCIL